VLWISRAFLQTFIPALDDTIIAMVAAVSLFVLTAKDRTQPLVTWEEAVTIPWGTILLFGGGIAIAGGFQSTGLAAWIGQHLLLLDGISLFLLVTLVIATVNLLTEITSNLATTTMLLPILAPM